MIKKTALFLLCCYLFSATESSQFLKLPILVEHYLEHKQQQEDLSLWGFLYIHYANGDVRDSDYLQDMKLPFKTCSNQGYGEKPLNMRLAESLVPEDMVTAYLPPRLGYYKFMETAALRGSIWQPPKLG